MSRLPAGVGILERWLRPGVLVLAVLVFTSACGESAGSADGALPTTPIPAEEDPGLVHVHGLGVNPADGLVYAATHFGLWRLPDEGQAERVGDYAYDFMGFTVVGPDHFQASGHPTLVEDLPPLLGLIESTDGGQTWESRSLLGDADFHALRVAHDRVYGWNSSNGSFMVSEVSERAEEWERRSTTPVFDFVVDPDDPDGVVASVSESFDDVRLMRSSDGGRSWSAMDAPPVARLAWETADRLWGIGMDGSVWRSRDGGQEWDDVGGRVDGRPEAFLDAGESLFAAAGGAILQSRDDGQTWDVRHRSG